MDEAKNGRLRSARESIRREIEETTNLRGDIDARLYQLREELNHTADIISMMPLEVLTEIFIFSVDQDSFYTPAPFVIGHVCKSWRTLVWSTPRFWRNLTIDFAEDRIDVQRQLLEEWIDRSGKQPLYLELHINGDGRPTTWEPPRSIFKMLLKISERWSSLSVSERPFTNFREALRRIPHKFPLLTHIHLDGSFYNRIPWEFDVTSSALTHLSVSGIPAISFLRINWKSLSEIEARFDIDDCLRALTWAASSISVVNLSILGNVHAVTVTPDDQTTLLPRLRKLQLSIEPDSAHRGPRTSAFLAKIKAPALTSLTLFGADILLPDHLINFTQRSQCSLVEFNICNPRFHEDELANALRLIPSLERLYVRCEDPLLLFSESMLELLTPTLQNGPLECLPNLTRLTYYGRIFFTPESMLKMLNDRTEGAAASFITKKLKQLQINYCNAELFRTIDPNELFTFYQELGSVATETGVEVNLHFATEHGKSRSA